MQIQYKAAEELNYISLSGFLKILVGLTLRI